MAKTKKETNPVVAVASKLIPRRYINKTNKWIKSHKRTILLTAGGLSVLYGLYLEKKYGFKKTRAKQQRLLQMSKDVHTNTKFNLAMNERKIANLASELQKNQGIVGATDKALDQRVSLLEKALRGKDFHQYLKEHHKITNVKKIR